MKIKDIKEGTSVLTANGQSVVHKRHENGRKFCWKFQFSNGSSLTATLEHPIYNPEINQWVELGDYKIGDKALFRNNDGTEEVITFLNKSEHGFEEVYDLTVGGELENEHSNYYANGILTHNCVVYSLNGYHTAFFKANYPNEFLIANIKFARSSGKMTETETIAELIKEAREMGISVKLPNFANAELDPTYNSEDKSVYLGINSLRGIGATASEVLQKAAQHTETMQEFYEYCLNAKVDTGRMKKDGTPIMRSLTNKTHFTTLLNIGFFGDTKQVLQEVINNPDIYGDIVDPETLNKSEIELTNQALGFDFYSPFEAYRKTLPDQYQNNERYLILKVVELKSGQKNGRKWHMMKANSEIGQITCFMDSVSSIDKNDLLLVEYTRSKGDAINIRNYKLL